MTRTPETTQTAETLPFAEQLKTWNQKTETVRKDVLRTEIEGFRMVERFVETQLGKDVFNQTFAINNRALIKASTLPGIQASDLTTMWFNSRLINKESGALELSLPHDRIYRSTNSVSIDFRRGIPFKEWDGMNIYLKYFDGYGPDDTGRKVKVGYERVEVNFNYNEGYLPSNGEYYQISSVLGKDLVELLAKRDTLSQLSFAGSLLVEAFKRDPKTL